MQFSCYIEVNLICIILLGIIRYRLILRRDMMSTANNTMKQLLTAAVLLCVSDVVAIVSRGQTFAGARALVYASNILYLIMMAMISYLWSIYTRLRVGKQFTKMQNVLYSLPLLLFALVALSNPWHNVLFSVSADNLYQRGPGVFIHWVCSWFYMIYAGLLSLQAIREAGSWAQKNEYKPLLNFLILPAIGCVAQMLFYGVTTVQAGITLSLILVSLQMQENQISTDELTGINNRKAMRMWVDNVLHGEPVQLTAVMIDVNKFKSINDTYGHDVGDIALCDTASILRTVCSESRERLFLCRFGGDEFVIIGQEVSEQSMQQLTDTIQQTAKDYVQQVHRPFNLSLSVGHAGGACEDYEDFTHYLRLADENMYEEKKKSR